MSKDRAKNVSSKRAGRGWGRKEGNFPSPPSFIFGSRSIFRPAKTENPVPRRSSFFFCSETTLKRLLRRLRPRWETHLSREQSRELCRLRRFLLLRYQLQERLIRLDKTNQKNLETIETSLFALVLDERSPVTETEVTVTVLCSVLTRPRYCDIAALFREMPH